MENIIINIVIFVIVYLFASIPWGFIIGKMKGIDIRDHGSGNIGATNVRRLAGQTLGALTLAGDVLKGAIPVWLALTITGPGDVRDETYIAVVAFCAFTGHLYPVYLKFKDGGKGVATAAGCFFIISPAAGIVAIMVFIMFVCWVDRVSAGSLAAAAVLPLAVWEATNSTIFTVCAVATTIFIYIRHKENIKRLLAGTEPTISN